MVLGGCHAWIYIPQGKTGKAKLTDMYHKSGIHTLQVQIYQANYEFGFANWHVKLVEFECFICINDTYLMILFVAYT